MASGNGDPGGKPCADTGLIQIRLRLARAAQLHHAADHAAIERSKQARIRLRRHQAAWAPPMPGVASADPGQSTKEGA